MVPKPEYFCRSGFGNSYLDVPIQKHCNMVEITLNPFACGIGKIIRIPYVRFRHLALFSCVAWQQTAHEGSYWVALQADQVVLGCSCSSSCRIFCSKVGSFSLPAIELSQKPKGCRGNLGEPGLSWQTWTAWPWWTDIRRWWQCRFQFKWRWTWN